MKHFTKAFILCVTMVLLCMTMSLSTLANEPVITEIVVGKTQNPQTNAPYTLDEAWTLAQTNGTDKVEVILESDNETYADNLALACTDGKKTTLRFLENITTTSTAIVGKSCYLTMDLAGYTLTVHHQIGIHTQAKLTLITSSPGGKVENLMKHPLFSFAPNGTLSVGNDNHVLTLSGGKLVGESEVEARASFTNVHFEGVSLDVSRAPGIAIAMNEGCTFDTNGALGITAFGKGFTSENITICDNFVLARTEEADTYAILPSADTVNISFFIEGESMSSYYKKGVLVRSPSLEKYSVTINSNHYYLTTDEPIQEYATQDATYTAHYTGGAQISANYSLNTAIDFHAYIPATDEITHIDGVGISKHESVIVGGARYYVITFPLLAPKDAQDSLKIVLTVNLGQKTVTVDRYVSIIGYAEAAVENNLDAETLHLILQTMDYINKASIYFGGESSERIEKLLRDNNFTPYVWEAKNVKEIGTYENLRGACIDLNQKPGFVFYVRADYEGDVLVNGKVYNQYSDIVTMGGQSLKYIVVQVPANQMIDDITVVAGEDTLVYNLDTYIAGRASTEPYAHALYGYVYACKNYIA
ncbi:MAG: hypothetical protein IKC72_07650 [Clostridia bacterium]|nr:hypothetical protein [Clostridia bacterium]